MMKYELSRFNYIRIAWHLLTFIWLKIQIKTIHTTWQFSIQSNSVMQLSTVKETRGSQNQNHFNCYKLKHIIKIEITWWIGGYITLIQTGHSSSSCTAVFDAMPRFEPLTVKVFLWGEALNSTLSGAIP